MCDHTSVIKLYKAIARIDTEAAARYKNYYLKYMRGENSNFRMIPNIDSAMTWNLTDEGNDYWAELHRKVGYDV
jgi:hypothetical protein